MGFGYLKCSLIYNYFIKIDEVAETDNMYAHKITKNRIEQKGIRAGSNK